MPRKTRGLHPFRRFLPRSVFGNRIKALMSPGPGWEPGDKRCGGGRRKEEVSPNAASVPVGWQDPTTRHSAVRCATAEAAQRPLFVHLASKPLIIPCEEAEKREAAFIQGSKPVISAAWPAQPTPHRLSVGLSVLMRAEPARASTLPPEITLPFTQATEE
ncbi:hypothetical protein AAFF_G00135740 [Aldrovandia affinis]|uniref:Uncharacterized protein n=1 Tax=Aldrovandia affinis TaxID=143900 RepID=A0AAD7RQC0_9TELE|nr:hypothetical protein AAFF_G00135740 [Aldrovandia affinis]